MDLTNLTIRQLEVIATVIERKSVSKAAVELELSQSSVSHTLARARKVLGDQLVIPEGGRMEPSTKALALLVQINKIVGLAKVSVNDEPKTLNGHAKTIRIYCTSDIVEIYGTTIYETLRVEGFQGSISFPRTTRKSFSRMERDPLTLVIRPAPILPATMIQKKISDESWTLICSAEHPMANRRMPKYEELLKHDFVVVRLFDGVPTTMDIIASMRGESRCIPVFVKHYHEMIPFLLSGKMIGTVPHSVAEHLARIHPLELVTIDQIDGLPNFSMSLAWFPQFSNNPASIRLRELVLDVLTSGPR